MSLQQQIKYILGRHFNSPPSTKKKWKADDHLAKIRKGDNSLRIITCPHTLCSTKAQVKKKKSTNEDGIGLEAIEPAQEDSEKTNPKKLQS